ncbi:MAG: hypothetical protein ACK53T_00115 [Planctomycetota bacterium]|jgi:hypothetical protein
MSKYGNLLGSFGNGIANADAATLAVVCLAMRDGDLSFDQSANDGKGRFKGTTALVKAVNEAAYTIDREYVERTFTKSTVSKVGTVVVKLVSNDVRDADNLLDACKEWLASRSLSGLYDGLNVSQEPKTWTLSGALATVVAKARKEGIEDAVVLETLVAILTGE